MSFWEGCLLHPYDLKSHCCSSSDDTAINGECELECCRMEIVCFNWATRLWHTWHRLWEPTKAMTTIQVQSRDYPTEATMAIVFMQLPSCAGAVSTTYRWPPWWLHWHQLHSITVDTMGTFNPVPNCTSMGVAAAYTIPSSRWAELHSRLVCIFTNWSSCWEHVQQNKIATASMAILGVLQRLEVMG